MSTDWTQVDWPAKMWAPEPDEPVFVGPLTEQEQAEQDYYADQAVVYDTPEYRAFEEAQYAEHIGAATHLTRCYLCYLEQTGESDMTPNSDLGPLRGVVRSGSVRTHPYHPEADVYATLTLTCGHTII